MRHTGVAERSMRQWAGQTCLLSRGESGVSNDLRQKLASPAKGKPPTCYKNLRETSRIRKGGANGTSYGEQECRWRGAHLGKWWWLGRWSPAVGTGAALAFLWVGSPPAAGGWKPRVGSLLPVCAISLFGCWTTPGTGTGKSTCDSRSSCPITPRLGYSILSYSTGQKQVQIAAWYWLWECWSLFLSFLSFKWQHYYCSVSWVKTHAFKIVKDTVKSMGGCYQQQGETKRKNLACVFWDSPYQIDALLPPGHSALLSDNYVNYAEGLCTIIATRLHC